MDAHAVGSPDRSEQRAGQQGDAEPSGDATKDSFQRAKLQMPAYRYTATCKQRLQPLAVGATGAQHHSLHFACSKGSAQSFVERRNTGRGEQAKLLAKHYLLVEFGLSHRTAD